MSEKLRSLWSHIPGRKLPGQAQILDCVEGPQMLSGMCSTIAVLRLSWAAGSLLAVEREGGLREGVWLAPGESEQLQIRDARSGCEARPVARLLGVRNLVSCSPTDSACGLWVTAYGDSVSQT